MLAGISATTTACTCTGVVRCPEGRFNGTTAATTATDSLDVNIGTMGRHCERAIRAVVLIAPTAPLAILCVGQTRHREEADHEDQTSQKSSFVFFHNSFFYVFYPFFYQILPNSLYNLLLKYMYPAHSRKVTNTTPTATSSTFRHLHSSKIQTKVYNFIHFNNNLQKYIFFDMLNLFFSFNSFFFTIYTTTIFATFSRCLL